MSKVEANHNMNELLYPGAHVHIVGIGGAGMSAIARVLLGRKLVVSGSDISKNEFTRDLTADGAVIFHGHSSAHIRGADWLLASAAIPENNPEIEAARSAGLVVAKRQDLLAHLSGEMVTIAVAGTHGKTTTTAMITEIMLQAGLSPTYIIGGTLASQGNNGQAGEGEFLIVEADEYDRMFLSLEPLVAVITNVDHDHPDHYPTVESYRQAFAEFVSKVPAAGMTYGCWDDAGATELLGGNYKGPTTFYGLDGGDWQAVSAQSNQNGGSDFVVSLKGNDIGVARLRLPGRHNISNALAAIAVAMDQGIPFSVCRDALASFKGVGRRFEVLGEAAGVTVVDDYAHHPREIEATLQAARERYPDRRIWAIWQPHTFSRLNEFGDLFGASFARADRVVALDVFGSREHGSRGLDMADFVERFGHKNARHIGPIPAAATYVLENLMATDVVITMNAGDGRKVAETILKELQRSEQTNDNGGGMEAAGEGGRQLRAKAVRTQRFYFGHRSLGGY